MIAYGQTVWRKKLESWLNLEKFVKRIKLLQLVGKGSRRCLFLKGIKEKDQTTEMKEDRTNKMKEDRTTRMTEDLTTGLIEDLTEEDKTKNLMLKKSDALVAKVMVI